MAERVQTMHTCSAEAQEGHHLLDRVQYIDWEGLVQEDDEGMACTTLLNLNVMTKR